MKRVLKMRIARDTHRRLFGVPVVDEGGRKTIYPADVPSFRQWARKTLQRERTDGKLSSIVGEAP